MQSTPRKAGKPKLSAEAKKHLIQNLDFEVEHRTRQLEQWLGHALQNFMVQQENQVTQITKQVRRLTMREFMQKYDGNVHAALQGIQKDKVNAQMKAAGIEDGLQSPKKRKWLAAQEDADSTSGSNADESSKGAKSARTIPSTPKRKVGKASINQGTGHRPLFNGSSKPGPSRIPQSPSPNKSRLLQTNMLTRPPSPSKSSQPNPSSRRPPSSSTFNPAIPKGRPYPTDAGGPARLPRRDETFRSVNGSPLANPYHLGFGWFKSTGDDDNSSVDGDAGAMGARKLKRTKSTISIRRDPSFAHGSSTTSGLHSRTNSQASMFGASTSTSSNASTMYSAHSRSNSQTEADKTFAPNFDVHTPKPPSRVGSAFVTIPTRDGHLLEFDALLTSPGHIDSLGITDSAKKQARQEIGNLIQAAVGKWKVDK
ncbi:hypothetical protein BDV98DRAFT_528015 [Pterulicium gracile]|uniref:Borealin N-terminal domain-containing protein n=1 Tax=Pterulicium gracile TaxID=1884261 RepID=A0A5C3QQ22_9AGAR|nr:hypothetical protein BDV98DRAFT_528015 [Pterula gracilis]